MRNKRFHAHKGWLLRRLAKLPDNAPTSEVARILKISIKTLQRWTADPYFRQKQVAVKGRLQWLWKREELKWWLVAVFKLSAPAVVAMNPGGFSDTEQFNWQNARQHFDMPLNYSVWSGTEIQGESEEGEE